MVILVQNMKTANKQFFLNIFTIAFQLRYDFYLQLYIMCWKYILDLISKSLSVYRIFLVIESKYKKSLEIQDYS